MRATPCLELLLRLVGLPHVQEHVSLERVVEGHGPDVVGFLAQRVLLVQARERLRRLSAVDEDDRLGEHPRPAFSVGAGLRGDVLELGGRLLVFALIQERHRDSLMRVEEVRIDRQRLAVLGDRVVEAAHLQKQLGIRIVGVGIVRDQLDVPLEGLLGVGELVALTVRIAHEVVRGRERRVDLGGFAIVLEGLRKILLAEVPAGHREIGPLVVGIGREELVEVLLLLDGVVVRGGLLGQDQQPLTVRSLVRQRHGFLEVLEELRPGGRVLSERQLRPCEARIQLDRLAEMLQRVRDLELVDHVLALHELGLRLRGRRRDGDLPVGAAARRARRVGGRRGSLLFGAAGDRQNDGNEERGRSKGSKRAHRVLLRSRSRAARRHG